MTQLAYCGLDCSACDMGKKTGCPGCQKAAGKPLWGECKLAKCCIAKGLAHCGKCAEFPCEDLKEFSFHKQFGDNGRRIENLRAVE